VTWNDAFRFSLSALGRGTGCGASTCDRDGFPLALVLVLDGTPLWGFSSVRVVRCPDFIGWNACSRSLGRSLAGRSGVVRSTAHGRTNRGCRGLTRMGSRTKDEHDVEATPFPEISGTTAHLGFSQRTRKNKRHNNGTCAGSSGTKPRVQHGGRRGRGATPSKWTRESRQLTRSEFKARTHVAASSEVWIYR